MKVQITHKSKYNEREHRSMPLVIKASLKRKRVDELDWLTDCQAILEIINSREYETIKLISNEQKLVNN
jgi:hypothetical protein